ncbi:hypothetical protein H0264_22625 [Nocardia huaxiensis]|uniref:DUF6777 domain-containing protein n=1 Tax=Nocardia huaxiensis TaxID=2755382 RepID=A0A7D6ZL21_9NOCA|nr:DUF6777 domain-containing protein [Nocardia huaxiensis]QLY28185.1 hypothetical protein H0264_22625 [Nocardia huaxiensis]
MSEKPDRQGPEPGSAYTTDVERSEGILVGAGIQFNLFHRDDTAHLRLTRLGFFATLVVILLTASSVFATAIALRSNSESLGPPEVLLEPSDQQGANPFMPTPPAVYHPDGTQPVADLPGTAGSAAAKPYSGDLPGVYSAPRDRALTERDELIAFYGTHPDEASSAAAVFASDTTFSWSQGKRLAGPELVQYLRELTPVLLRIDVRITNYALVEGRPVAHQSILQAGTAVLVDDHGVPRFRSLSGSPLTLATALPHAPKLTGAAWPGFDVKHVGAISPGTSSLIRITLIDTVTGRPFDRPVGTTGESDIDHTDWPSTTTPAAAAPQPTTPATTTVSKPPPPTAAPAALDLSGSWIVQSDSSYGESSVTGTMQRTSAGFAFHKDEIVAGSYFSWDCTLPDRFGEPVTMVCRNSGAVNGESYSSETRYDGTLAMITWGSVLKFRFDGVLTPENTSMGRLTIVVQPQ